MDRDTRLHWLRRLGIVIGAFVVASVTLRLRPDIDLGLARAFVSQDGRFAPASWATFPHEALSYCVGGAMTIALGLLAFNRLRRRAVLGVTPRAVVYLTLVLSLGAGLIVNAGLKDHVGRARPRDVVEFGGTKQFTPAYVPSDQCRRNCSFSSGDVAGAFFFLAVARVCGGRRRGFALAGAATFGALVAASRIASGAHFFSDTVVSFFVMLILTEALRPLLDDPGPPDRKDALYRRD